MITELVMWEIQSVRRQRDSITIKFSWGTLNSLLLRALLDSWVPCLMCLTSALSEKSESKMELQHRCWSHANSKLETGNSDNPDMTGTWHWGRHWIWACVCLFLLLFIATFGGNDSTHIPCSPHGYVSMISYLLCLLMWSLISVSVCSMFIFIWDVLHICCWFPMNQTLIQSWTNDVIPVSVNLFSTAHIKCGNNLSDICAIKIFNSQQ